MKVSQRGKTISIRFNDSPEDQAAAKAILEAERQKPITNAYAAPYEIWSGGQTGADQGGLVAAEELGIKTGGWVPLGCKTEYGSDPGLIDRFGLQEHDSPDYAPRTILNATQTDGTVWFGYTTSPGYKLTAGAAKRAGKPILCNPTPEELRDWVSRRNIRRLNVAGNRASTNPKAYDRAYSTIKAAWS